MWKWLDLKATIWKVCESLNECDRLKIKFNEKKNKIIKLPLILKVI